MTASLRRHRPDTGATGRPTRRALVGFALEALERRELLAGMAPTDAEQYMLELINRARANPAAEGTRLLALAQSNPLIHQATAGWDLGLFYRTISSYAPEPPLAFNPRLIDAALAEDASMLARNDQRHSPAGFLNDPGVAVDTDGRAYYATGSSYWATGENIFAFSQGVSPPTDATTVDFFEAGFLLDWGNPDFGHLKNLLAPGPAEANLAAGVYPFNEVGVGLLTNVTPTTPPPGNPANPSNAGINVGPDLVTQEFGWKQGNAFLTGTFYVDAQNTHSYAPGEGLGGVTIQAVGLGGQGTFTTQTWSSGGYSLQLPAGTYAVTSYGPSPGPRSTIIAIGLDNVAWGAAFAANTQADVPVPADYDGLGHAEMATYRPSTGDWSIKSPVYGPRTFNFGIPGDIPVPGHYDGGAAEVAVYRPSNGYWFILGPHGGRAISFGQPGDIPVPGDYDGDGKTDLAVFRPSNDTWYIYRSKTGTVQVQQWGIPGLDQPVPAAYDGGGVAEIAVVRPSTWQWFIISPAGVRVVQYGVPGDIPVPGDYDGLGKAEVAVYDPSIGGWFVQNTGRFVQYGIPNLDQPAPADYDGDGRLDMTAFRPNTAEWFVKGSRGGWIYDQYGQGGTAQNLKALIAAASPSIPAAWSSWIAAPGAEADHGAGPAARVVRPTVRIRSARPAVPTVATADGRQDPPLLSPFSRRDGGRG